MLELERRTASHTDTRYGTGRIFESLVPEKEILVPEKSSKLREARHEIPVIDTRK